MRQPTQAPAHCVLYAELAVIARSHGYALAIHGSMARDFDLVCVPWVETVADPQVVIGEIVSTYAFTLQGEPALREHGRLAYSLVGQHGWCGHLDISFTPRVEHASTESPQDVEEWSRWRYEQTKR